MASTFLFPLISALLGAVISGIMVWRHAAHDRSHLDWMRKTYLRRQGFEHSAGNYELMSLDGGLEWYAIERTRDKHVIAKGTAEKVFPGLLGRLAGMESLVEHVRTHGPLDLTGALTPQAISVLNKAGFEVKTSSA